MLPIISTPTRIELKKENDFLSFGLTAPNPARFVLSPESWKRLANGTIRWANGVYGPCRLTIDSKAFETKK